MSALHPASKTIRTWMIVLQVLAVPGLLLAGYTIYEYLPSYFWGLSHFDIIESVHGAGARAEHLSWLYWGLAGLLPFLLDIAAWVLYAIHRPRWAVGLMAACWGLCLAACLLLGPRMVMMITP